MGNKLFFQVVSKLGVNIRLTDQHWQLIAEQFI